MEFAKINQPLIKIEPNKTYGKNFSVVKLNQRENGGKIGKEDGERVCVTDKNAKKIEIKADSKVFFGTFYRIIEMNGINVTAECNSCKLIVNDSILTSKKMGDHLKVCKVL